VDPRLTLAAGPLAAAAAFCAAAAQLVALAAAFAAALALARRARPEGVSDARLALGLAAGAACAHLGWAVLHAPAVARAPAALLDPTAGFCALFVPLGVLLAAPAARARRAAYLRALVPALPLALAAARLGCVAAGCCAGVAWGVPGSESAGATLGLARHPVALYEAAGLVALHALLRRAPAGARAGLALVGLGGVRLAVEPFRAPPPLGAPLVAPGWLAAAWLAAGAALATRATPGARRCPRTGGPPPPRWPTDTLRRRGDRWPTRGAPRS